MWNKHYLSGMSSHGYDRLEKMYEESLRARWHQCWIMESVMRMLLVVIVLMVSVTEDYVVVVVVVVVGPGVMHTGPNFQDQ